MATCFVNAGAQQFPMTARRSVSLRIPPLPVQPLSSPPICSCVSIGFGREGCQRKGHFVSFESVRVTIGGWWALQYHLTNQSIAQNEHRTGLLGERRG